MDKLAAQLDIPDVYDPTITTTNTYPLTVATGKDELSFSDDMGVWPKEPVNTEPRKRHETTPPIRHKVPGPWCISITVRRWTICPPPCLRKTHKTDSRVQWNVNQTSRPVLFVVK